VADLSGPGRTFTIGSGRLQPALLSFGRTAFELHFSSPERGYRGLEGGMLETIAIILIVLWLLGLVSGYTLGNFIYVLLVIAIVLFLVRLISGRRVV
jgi:hypothetical protein